MNNRIFVQKKIEYSKNQLKEYILGYIGDGEYMHIKFNYYINFSILTLTFFFFLLVYCFVLLQINIK